MKLRIKQVGVVQCAKMIAALYFVLSLPIIVGLLLVGMSTGQSGFSVAVLIVFPFTYALVSYLAALLCAWIYNLVAQRVGGFEYTAAEITS